MFVALYLNFNITSLFMNGILGGMVKKYLKIFNNRKIEKDKVKFPYNFIFIAHKIAFNKEKCKIVGIKLIKMSKVADCKIAKKWLFKILFRAFMNFQILIIPLSAVKKLFSGLTDLTFIKLLIIFREIVFKSI